MLKRQSSITDSSDDLLKFLSQTKLLANLSDEFLRDFQHIIKMKSYSKGESIYTEERSAEYCYIIKSGWVKLYHETLDGKEAIVDVLTIGHLLGQNSIFHSNKHISNAQVIKDTELLLIPISKLIEQMHLNSELTLNMLKLTIERSNRQTLEIEHLSLQTAAQRIGCFMLKLCQNNNYDARIELDLPYDKTLVALRLGMSGETFSRSLNILRNEAGVTVSGSCFIINSVSKLTDFTCCTCSLCYPSCKKSTQ